MSSALRSSSPSTVDTTNGSCNPGSAASFSCRLFSSSTPRLASMQTSNTPPAAGAATIQVESSEGVVGAELAGPGGDVGGAGRGSGWRPQMAASSATPPWQMLSTEIIFSRGQLRAGTVRNSWLQTDEPDRVRVLDEGAPDGVDLGGDGSIDPRCLFIRQHAVLPISHLQSIPNTI